MNVYGRWFSGWWISPDGKIIEIEDSHTEYIIKHPTQFGYTRRELNNRGYKLPFAGDDQTLEIEAMHNGWIRVRQHKSYLTYNFSGFDDWTLARIRMHINKAGLWDNDRVMIMDISKEGYGPAEVTVGWLKSDDALSLVSNVKTKVMTRFAYALYVQQLINLLEKEGPLTIDEISNRLGEDINVIRCILQSKPGFCLLNDGKTWNIIDKVSFSI